MTWGTGAWGSEPWGAEADAGGGSATDLIVQDATHAHTADNLTLTTSGTVSLTIADAAHAHTADIPTLTLGYVDLTIADALHGHSADSLTLTVDGSVDLAIDDALHGHSADNLTIGGVLPVARRHAGGYRQRKGYIIKGQRYWLDEVELAVKVAELITDISRGDVKEVTAGKPKTISKRTWDAIKPLERIEAMADMLNFNEDDEEEALLMLM